MKKIFAIFVAMLFVASLSFAVVGCKKAEEPAPAEAPKVEASTRCTCCTCTCEKIIA